MGVWNWLRHSICRASASAKAGVFGAAVEKGQPAAGGNGGNDSVHRARFEAICDGIRDGKYKNIIVLSGAGVSTACGIPDFRSRTGLYELSHIFPHLPSAWSVFDYNFFRRDPVPFYYLVRKMMLKPTTDAADTAPQVASYSPSLAHHFLRMLDEKGALLRVYTQNVDCMELVAGLSPSRLVQFHGTMAKATCTSCHKSVSLEVVKAALLQQPTQQAAPQVAPSAANIGVPKCPKCDGIVKPDVVLFNEGIPVRAFAQTAADLPRCDLLICMGSTFQVMPFAQLIDKVDDLCPRLLLNMEKVAHGSGDDPLASNVKRFRFDDADNYRDVFIPGAIDESVMQMARRMGWAEELTAARDGSQRRLSIDTLIEMANSS
jgi:NAD-dependent deacetylase sirtuin 2